MGYLIFLAMFVCAVLSLGRPWIGVVGAYLFAILTPQAVWFWIFGGMRPVYWILLPTTIGFIVALLRGQYDLSILKNRRTGLLLVLWLCMLISYYAGPFVRYHGDYPGTDPDWYVAQLNKIFFLFFIGSVCLNDERKLKALFYVVVFSAVYLIYWANAQYLTGRIMMSRLAGPVDVEGNGIYADENNFAMLFVVVQPFLWYFGLSLKSWIWRATVWLLIPFGWHAIFLTASRGGLIGITVVTLLTSLKSRYRFLGLALIPAFFVAYLWQAGEVMKNRAESIGDTNETSTATRIEAWTAASRMIADHPLTGVGLASFVRTFEHYSDKHPREAHNTLLQVAAESGALAGLAYLGLVVSSIAALSASGKRLRATRPPDDFLYLLSEATRISLWGFAVCALFLSLQLFEFFYCLILISNSVLFLTSKSQAQRQRIQAPIESAVRIGPAVATLLPGNSSAS